MRNPLLVARRALFTGGAAVIAYLLYLHGTYAERMPRMPDPTAGRTEHVFVMRSDRYVSKAEASRLNWATRILPVFVAGFIGAIYLQKRHPQL
jgi:hypothetical protein